MEGVCARRPAPLLGPSLADDVSWGLGLHADVKGSFGMGGIGGFAGFGVRRPGLAAGFGDVTCRLGSHERADACADALEAALGV